MKIVAGFLVFAHKSYIEIQAIKLYGTNGVKLMTEEQLKTSIK